MTSNQHPDQALYAGERPFPVLTVCEHFAGNQKLIGKAMSLQQELGPIFDITCDCEDGAATGQNAEHANMVADAVNSPQNSFDRVGVRIHDPDHDAWKEDVNVIVGLAASRLAYVTVPKVTSAHQTREVVAYIQQVANANGRRSALPVHVLIETHAALRDVFDIAGLDHVEVLDFGQMDFVSAHHGAIPASAMRSPEQFTHPLIVRAKTDIVAAAMANGVVPSHSVCLNLREESVIHDDAARARREFGFQRMWSIHPAQIPPIIKAMQPGQDETRQAGEILLAAQDKQWGPIRYEDELHDRATYRYYWGVLRRAHSTGMSLPTPVKERFFQEQA